MQNLGIKIKTKYSSIIYALKLSNTISLHSYNTLPLGKVLKVFNKHYYFAYLNSLVGIPKSKYSDIFFEDFYHLHSSIGTVFNLQMRC